MVLHGVKRSERVSIEALFFVVVENAGGGGVTTTLPPGDH